MCRFKGIFCLLIWSACSLGLFGQQSTSNMLGTITDPADAVVPKAVLTAIEAATGNVHTTTSDGSGLFRFNDIPPGKYALRVNAAGFKVLEICGP